MTFKTILTPYIDKPTTPREYKSMAYYLFKTRKRLQRFRDSGIIIK